MATITLNDGSQVWSNFAKVDMKIKDLETHIKTGPNSLSTESIQILKELGTLASDSVVALEKFISTLQVSTPYKDEIINLLEVINPVKTKEKPQLVDIEIKSGDLETDAQTYKKCNFCEKYSLFLKDCYFNKLCTPGTFYCKFCLRHNYHTRNNVHLLMLSFKSIFGYYFWQFYFNPPRPYMWLLEIKDYISIHEQIGLQNPLFNYDPDTYTWFIDFRKIGDSKKKLPLVEVQKTILEILAVCNLHVHVKGLSMSDFYQKYFLAINDFYQKRTRPEGKRLLCPTFLGCGTPEWGSLSYSGQLTYPTYEGNKIGIEDTRNFSPEMFKKHLWNKISSQ